jgi:hypothetical protein
LKPISLYCLLYVNLFIFQHTYVINFTLQPNLICKSVYLLAHICMFTRVLRVWSLTVKVWVIFLKRYMYVSNQLFTFLFYRLNFRFDFMFGVSGSKGLFLVSQNLEYILEKVMEIFCTYCFLFNFCIFVFIRFLHGWQGLNEDVC